MAFLEINNLCKSYGKGENRSEVLKDINLHVEEGEFVAIVGFTGSGKTTLINQIAGLDTPDSGEVLLNGRPITGPSAERAIVFQNYSLLPWLTVFDNVYVAVREVFTSLSKAERKAHTLKYIEMVGLQHAIHKRPAELSGGMRQRVSVARALAMQPRILLLDEPLSALDALTRSTIQDEIARIWAQEKITVVLITNDVDEGILLADRIVPLNPGLRATLGPSFEVKLPRPRDKKALNRNEDFIKLRNRITKYLICVGMSRHQPSSGNDKLILPDLRPKKLHRTVNHSIQYPSKMVNS